MYKRILVPVDGSNLSKKAARAAVSLAKLYGAQVIAVTATPTFRVFSLNPLMVTDTAAAYARDSKEMAARILAAIGKMAMKSGVSFRQRHVVSDAPYDAIIRTAKRDRCDLVVMASHGRRGVSGLLLGSETVKVLTHAKVPVLVYR